MMNKKDIYPTLDAELEYCDCIAEVSSRNKKKPVWLASSVCSKNPSIINHINYLEGKTDLKKAGILTLLDIFIKKIYRRRLLTPAKLKRNIKTIINEARNSLLFFTVFRKKSFSDTGRYEDFYWGKLIDKAAEEKKIIAIGYLISDEHEVLKKLKETSASNNILFIPLEYFMLFRGCLKALLVTLLGKVKISEIYWQGKNIAPALKSLIKAERYNGEIFNNLCAYFAFQKMLKVLMPEKIYYPWENHSWEKLMLLSVEQAAEKTKTIGFQHSTVPLMYINHFPSSKDLGVDLFPDKLLTTGDISYNILRRYGSFPDDCLMTGAGLRYEYLQKVKMSHKKIHNDNIVIGVATPWDEDDTFSLLEAVKKLSLQYKLKLRHYPLMSQDALKKIYSEFSQDCFSNGPVEAFFAESDIVVYTNTTMGLEAINSGIPAIYFDVGRGLIGDPIFNNSALKWTAASTAELLECIEEITSTPMDTLEVLRKQARNYVDRSFLPVTEENIKQMINL